MDLRRPCTATVCHRFGHSLMGSRLLGTGGKLIAIRLSFLISALAKRSVRTPTPWLFFAMSLLLRRLSFGFTTFFPKRPPNTTLRFCLHFLDSPPPCVGVFWKACSSIFVLWLIRPVASCVASITPHVQPFGWSCPVYAMIRGLALSFFLL